jgi:hypothetical protein
MGLAQAHQDMIRLSRVISLDDPKPDLDGAEFDLILSGGDER